MTSESNLYRHLPSIDELLRSPSIPSWFASFSHELVVHALRSSITQARHTIQTEGICPSREDLLLTAEHLLREQQQPFLRPVINATGVIINTNLGRAPLSKEALLAVEQVAQGYSNLEYDLEQGARGSRHAHVDLLLRELTGAEAALVTNNNAAAVLLGLSALAAERDVVISRGQLVEIGGGFRIPDVMRQSGCTLVEVGTTNKTRIDDYKAALTERTAVLLSVHPSNFLITGFTESVSIQQMAEVAHQHATLVMDDLGSGCLLNCEHYGLTHEPTPQESLAAGADLVCFSGDKLLGGPQAGILVGKQAVIAQLARHPLMRAVRIDKMTLAALEATLRLYQRGLAASSIPVWRMISAHSEEIKKRAVAWVQRLQAQEIISRVQRGESTIGGGSLPGETVTTSLLALDAKNCYLPLNEIMQRLRQRPTPIIARISKDTLLLDPRTVLVEQDDELMNSLIEAIRS